MASEDEQVMMSAEEYKKKLSDFFHSSCACLCIALAKQTGILDVLYAADDPLTVSEIAERNNCKDRYVKELLGSLVAAGVVEISNDSTRFHVPEQFKAYLKKYAVLCSYPVDFEKRFDTIKKCFKEDGPYGILYSEFPSVCQLFHTYKGSESESIIGTLTSAPGLIEKLELGIDVLELGCNTGVVLIGLAKRFPNSRFLGGDIAECSIKQGRNTAMSMNLKNIEFDVLNVMNLPKDLSDKYDWGFLQDVLNGLSNPEKGLTEMHRCLKPEGVLCIIEGAVTDAMAQHANNNHALFYYTISTFVCLPSSFQHGKAAALGAMCRGDDIRRAIRKSGFKITSEKDNEKDEFSKLFVCQK